MQVECTPPDAPKLNGMVERGFTIKWEAAKTFLQNVELNPSKRRIKNCSGCKIDRLFLK